ncbi:hypothetical protein K438DRAFT_1784703 [Mycena galopus ATCC 62051]|nr:hypothetical protein K438DRAFT_1784703 [Mycena galopus ATCC 62051]
MLNITWHVGHFASTTTTTIAPAQEIWDRQQRMPTSKTLCMQCRLFGNLLWYFTACLIHDPGQTRRKAQRAGTVRVDITGTGIALESIASGLRRSDLATARVGEPSSDRYIPNENLNFYLTPPLVVCGTVLQDMPSLRSGSLWIPRLDREHLNKFPCVVTELLPYCFNADRKEYVTESSRRQEYNRRWRRESRSSMSVDETINESVKWGDGCREIIEMRTAHRYRVS